MMNRDTAVTTWRDVCGSDTVMASGIVTGRMLEEFARRIEMAEYDRWIKALQTAAGDKPSKETRNALNDVCFYATGDGGAYRA